MIDAAIVGLGWWGKVLVNAVQGKSKKIRFVKATTRTLANAEAFAREHHLELVEGLDTILADRKIDAVVLATPHSHHATQIIHAAEAGKHVMVEKPLTLTVASARAAIRAAERAGIVLALGYNRRFHPNMAELHQWLKDDRVGTLLFCDYALSAPNGMFLPRDTWRVDRGEAPAGALTGLGVHAVDLIIDLFGEIEDVYCRSVRRVVQNDTGDTTVVSLAMKNGMLACVSCSIASAPSYRFAVYGSKAIVEITKPTLDNLLFSPAPQSAMIPEGPSEMIMRPGFDLVRGVLEAFADSIHGIAPFPISHNQMIHGVAAFEAIVRSAVSGQVERVL